MPPPTASVGVKPAGITSLADIVNLDEALEMPPPQRANVNQWSPLPPLPEMDMSGKSWDDQVAAVRLYHEEYPDASLARISKALHLYANKVHYVMTGKLYPSEKKNTYPPLPPVAAKPRTTPLPEPPRPVRPTAVELGIKLDPDSMVMRTA